MIDSKQENLFNKKQHTTAFISNDIKLLDVVCSPPSVDDESFLKALEISIQILKQGNDMNGSIALSTIYNILCLKQDVSCIPYLLQQDFFNFLLEKITSDFVHLSFRKNALLLIRLIMDLYPPISDSLLQMGLFEILEKLLPDTSSCDCLKTCMKNSENFRQYLILNQFQKKILLAIQSVDQFFPIRIDHFIDNYVSILDVLRIFLPFDLNDYDSFLTLFVHYFTNISVYGSKALDSFLLFLNSSDDLNLMNIFMKHPLNIVEKILIHFESFEEKKYEFFVYLDKIATRIPEYSHYLSSSMLSKYYIGIISNIDTYYGDFNLFFGFIITISQVSYQNLIDVFTRDFFCVTAEKFETGEFDVKQSIFKLYMYILMLPANSNFFDYFFMILDSIMEYIGIVLSDENNDETILVIIDLINKVLTESLSTNNRFFEGLLALLQAPDFQDVLSQLTIDENIKICEHASLLEETIERFGGK